jgi:hypothetical protein
LSRLASLSRHPRRTLATLATVLAAVGVTVASGADFTASAANPANVFSTGTLSVTDSQSSAILTAANMRPGDAASEGTVDIANTGSLSGTFALNVATPVDTDTVHPLSQQLNVTIDDCGTFTGGTAPACGDADDVNKYTGSLSQMGQPGHAVSSLGTFAGGVKHRYRFRVALDSGAGNVYQGAGSTATFTWNAA